MCAPVMVLKLSGKVSSRFVPFVIVRVTRSFFIFLILFVSKEKLAKLLANRSIQTKNKLTKFF